jgi:uncharacterized membrane protein YkgB
VQSGDIPTAGNRQEVTRMDTRFHVPRWLQPLDRHLTAWMDRHGVLLLRVAVGLVFVWFGALKLIPGASPATGLIVSTYPFLPERLFVASVGCWEVVIGLGFVTGRLLRVTVALMYLQMLGAMSPVALNPAAVFVQPPFVLTLEGQYIVKNLVLLAAAIVIGARVR